MKVVIIGGAAGSKISQEIFMSRNIPIVGFMNNFLKKEHKHHLVAPDHGDIHLRKNLKILKNPNVAYFIGTGINKIRMELTEELVELTGKYPINATHPSAIISRTATLGRGNLIMPLAVINAHSSIGDGTIINTGCIIEHDNVIGDYAQISPGVTLGGYVTVNKLAYVNINASVAPHVTIGEGAVVSMNAGVLKDVASYMMVIGTPAVEKRNIR